MPSSIVGSVAASVAGSVISGALGGKASKAQSDAAGKATDAQLQMYNQTREDLAPYRSTGVAANTKLSQLMGLDDFDRTAIGDKLKTAHPELYGTASTSTANPTPTPPNPSTNPFNHTTPMWSQWVTDNLNGNINNQSASNKTTTDQQSALNAAIDAQISQTKNDPSYGSLAKKFTLADYTADPGYQFRLDQGNKALSAAQAARGGFYSGAALKEANAYNSGQASQEYGNAYNRFNTDQSNLYSRLGGIVGTGSGATNSAVSANQNNATALGNIYGQAGNAAAASSLNQGANLQNGLSSILGQSQYGGGGYNSAASSFYNPGTYNNNGLPWSDMSLKQNIMPAGTENGFPIYFFNYVKEIDPFGRRYVGVMAQEVLEKAPHAVHEREGYLCVDYDKIGVKFREAPSV